MPSEALSYFLDSPSEVVMLDTIEISHPAFSRVYSVVRNHPAGGGVRLTLEDKTTRWFEWYPMSIAQEGDQADLDSGLRIDFGDLGEVLPRELDAAHDSSTMDVQPEVVYRAYRSDDLGAPLVGPIRLKMTTVSFTGEGASFTASAPYVNNTRTGENYDLTRFPMLRGFLT